MNNNRGNDPYNYRYRLNIVHLYPDLLNLYGDRGNIQCMRMRCKWRGIDANVIECSLDDHPELASADIVLLGGGSDREQQIVCTRLQKIRRDLHDLASILWTGEETKGRNKGDYKEMRIISSHSIRNGNIKINFDIDAAAYLTNAYMMNYPTALLKIDNRKPNAYEIGRKIRID